MVTLIALLCTSYSSLYYGLNLPLIIDGEICLTWIWLFFLGIKLRSSERNYNILTPMIFCVLGLLLSVLETIFWIKFNNCGYGANKLTSYIFSTGLILVLLSNKLYRRYESRIFLLIAKLGNYHLAFI